MLRTTFVLLFSVAILSVIGSPVGTESEGNIFDGVLLIYFITFSSRS